MLFRKCKRSLLPHDHGPVFQHSTPDPHAQPVVGSLQLEGQGDAQVHFPAQVVNVSFELDTVDTPPPGSVMPAPSDKVHIKMRRRGHRGRNAADLTDEGLTAPESGLTEGFDRRAWTVDILWNVQGTKVLSWDAEPDTQL